MKTKLGRATGDIVFDFFRQRKVHSHERGNLIYGIKTGLGIALLAAVTGCIGVVGGDGYGGGAVVVAPEPEVTFFGDYGGRDWHGYSHRGAESRGAAHGGGGGHGGRH